jgi:hypothetical protein
MPTRDELVRNVVFLQSVAELLAIPIRAAEHYPKGLGPTHPEVAKRLPAELPAKTAFSCCGAAGFRAELQSLGKTQVVLCGMEAHVCLLQTALDLREAGYTVFVAVDAIAARFAFDREIAMHRLDRAGCVLTTVESIAFEWLGDASHPQFKAMQKLVIERAKSLA